VSPAPYKDDDRRTDDRAYDRAIMDYPTDDHAVE
jgi:hypothetical protein